jgi:RNA polymerase sigma-B factor
MTVSGIVTAPPCPSTQPTDRPIGAGADAGVLLARFAALPCGDPNRRRLREQVIEAHLPLAAHLARRLAGRGEPIDDLVQVATVGLIKAVDGYDPARGRPFGPYAVPTILGELRRHFRDKGWHVRVPRRMQEMRMDINAAAGELTQRLGHAPTVAELAAELGIDEGSIVEGLDAVQAYRPLSLHAPAGGENWDAELGDLLGDVDSALEGVENRLSLEPLLATLPRREQKIIAMRFFGNRTQSQIAASLGISQMHVSRLLSGALAKLRQGLA